MDSKVTSSQFTLGDENLLPSNPFPEDPNRVSAHYEFKDGKAYLLGYTVKTEQDFENDKKYKEEYDAGAFVSLEEVNKIYAKCTSSVMKDIFGGWHEESYNHRRVIEKHNNLVESFAQRGKTVMNKSADVLASIAFFEAQDCKVTQDSSGKIEIITNS